MSKLIVIVPVLLAATPMNERPYAKELQALFKDTKQPASSGPRPGVMWSMRVSPAFPVTWPGSDLKLRRYAFAAGFDPHLRDGERVAAPFATVELSAKAFTVKRSSTSLTVIGTQGISPITREEAAIVQSIDGAEVSLSAGELGPYRDGYCAWISYNGVLSEHLRPSHAAFFKALDCK